jgi:hypothetical protein
MAIKAKSGGVIWHHGVMQWRIAMAAKSSGGENWRQRA